MPLQRGQGKLYRYVVKVKLLIQDPLLWSQLLSAKFMVTLNDRIVFGEALGKDVRTDHFIRPGFGDGTPRIVSRNVNTLRTGDADLRF